ncbi:MAG: PAS domain-containing protein [Deltaproteobacteria bacterium]|nr:PAS domain-containing protein [Deltaproteobacteria bacterium]
MEELWKERREIVRARGEIAFVWKDGTKFIGECSSTIFTDKSGRERTSMIIRDITAQKTAEQAQREANKHLNALIEAIPDMIFFKNVQGRYLIVNKRYLDKKYEDYMTSASYPQPRLPCFREAAGTAVDNSY